MAARRRLRPFRKTTSMSLSRTPLILGLCALLLSTLVAAEPQSAQSAADTEIRFWQSRTERDTLDYLSPTKLGILCLREGRRTGEFELLVKAAQAFQTALDRNPQHLP